MEWMAWTWQTALFFVLIFLTLVGMGVWSVKAPQAPRKGILFIETTPGDRLFISLLGSAWICLLWLAFMGSPLWWALLICVVFAAVVFRWV
ncbi:MAG: DUF2160 domain-containing protein [Thiolinea sp.]